MVSIDLIRIPPLLNSLHWLPIEQRIHIKNLLIAYRALKGEAPKYVNRSVL